ncbi:MAG: hypothetical protein QXK06_02035 [Candidatus Diapherotrites archaeon]
MLPKRVFLALIVLFAFFPLPACAWKEEFFAEGQLSASLDRNFALAGETLTANLLIENLSGVPLSEAYLVAQLVLEKTALGQPRENIVLETMSKKYFLNAGESKPVEMKIAIPKKASSGSYRIDFYLKTPRSFIVGIPFIFLNPHSERLEVKNNAVSSDVLIDREKTILCGALPEKNYEYGCYPGPVGVVGKAGEKNTLNLAIKNNGSFSQQVSLKISFYRYDDTVEEMLLAEKTVQAKTVIGAGETIEHPVEFFYPEKAGAYALRLEVFDSEGELLSLYRSRINVYGVSARVIAVFPQKKFFKAGERVLVEVKIISPSDSKTSDTNCTVRLSAKKGQREIHSESKKVSLLQDLPLQSVFFEFTAPEDLFEFEISAEILDSSGNEVDKTTQKIDYKDFSQKIGSFDLNILDSAGETPSMILVGDTIKLSANAVDEAGFDANAKIECFVFFGAQKAGPIVFEKKTELTERLSSGDYLLQCQAGKKKMEIPFFVSSVQKIVAKFADNCEFKEEKQKFTAGQEICVKAIVLNESGETLSTPTTMSIKGKDSTVGPIEFSAETKVSNLPEGKYIFKFESGGLVETYAVNFEAVTEPERLVLPERSIQTKAAHTPLSFYLMLVVTSIAVFLFLVGLLRIYRKRRAGK